MVRICKKNIYDEAELSVDFSQRHYFQMLIVLEDQVVIVSPFLIRHSIGLYSSSLLALLEFFRLCPVVVAILKRAQILVADIWACCGGEGLGEFTDIDELTAFADYRIPQSLLWLGVLEYSEDLVKALQNGKLYMLLQRRFNRTVNRLKLDQKLGTVEVAAVSLTSSVSEVDVASFERLQRQATDGIVRAVCRLAYGVLASVRGTVVVNAALRWFSFPGETLANGDRREVEIRGCTLWAIEVIMLRLLLSPIVGDSCVALVRNI